MPAPIWARSIPWARARPKAGATPGPAITAAPRSPASSAGTAASTANPNTLIAESAASDLKDTVVEHIVVRAARNPDLHELFNNAAQAWNHAFFWQCLAPDAKKPSGALAKKLDADLGGYDGFVKKFE